jgi:hypothetical protein
MSFRRSLLAVVGLLAGGLTVVAAPTAQAATCAVTDSMIKASTYWVASGTELDANNWSNATFHVGNLAQVRTTGISNHKTWPWTVANNHQLPVDPANPFAPDPQASGEPYLDVYYFHPEARVLQAVRDSLKAEAASVAQGHTRYWSTPDAVNMSLPSFVRIGVMDNDTSLLDTSRTLFRDAKRRLYSDVTGLWRGNAQANAWAVTGVAKAVVALPADSPYRAEYARVLKRSAETLRWLQRPDGFWNSEFLFGGRESASTAMFTYALAAGINTGVLDAATYTPIVQKAWQALTTTALQDSGRFGYVQPRGTHGRAGADDTAAFGVGSYLIAGQQIAKLTPGC